MSTIKSLFIIVITFCTSLTFAQTKEELKTLKAEKQAKVDKYTAEVDALQAKIDALPGWRTAVFGTIGGSLSRFEKWYSQGTPNISSGNLGFTVNGFANKIEEKYFWINSLNINLNWTKVDNRDDATDNDKFRSTVDVFNLTSIYGRKLSKTWAVSGSMEYRTALLEGNFNDPGYLDLGVGFTWTPITDLVVTINPLNYNFVFSSGDTVFNSSLGAKIIADYTRQIGKINFKTNLSAFQSYEDSNLSNWTWINSFSYTLWKGIGVGFDFGLRSNYQEAVDFALNQFDATSGNAVPNFDNVDNDIQSYYTVGVSYNF